MNEFFPLKDEAFQILGACFEVYSELGCGFLEPVYQECLAIELGSRNIPFESQKYLTLDYKGRRLSKTYQVDFVCFGSVVIEIKAVSKLTGEHRAQILNYLHASNIGVGLLVDFGHFPKLEHVRLLSRQLANPGLSV